MTVFLFGVWIGMALATVICFLAKRNRRHSFDTLIMERKIVDLKPGEGYDFGADQVDRVFAEKVDGESGCRIVRGRK